MKTAITREVRYDEVDPGFCIRLGSLFRRLQEAAILHSEEVGFGSKPLIEGGHAWILNKIAIRILDYPRFHDTLKVETWHKGSRGFRSYRDFEVFAGMEKLAAVASMWLFIDLKKKKIIKVPTDVSQIYSVEKQSALSLDIDRWRPEIRFKPEFSKMITIRSSDFDPLGHVNNVVYLDCIETMMESFLKHPPRIKSLIIQFNNEISKDFERVTAGLKPSGDEYLFTLFNDETAFAGGALQVTDTEL